MTRFARIALAGAAVALFAPATALAAPPTVTTGKADNVTQTTATLRGSVNPRGNPTFTFFQYGTSRIYGSQTAPVDRGAGGSPVPVADDIGGLSPFTRYQYRIVAQYGQKLVFGENKSFRTLRQPLGIGLGLSPTLIRPGGSTTVTGQISGTGNGGREVVLQANPFPFSGYTDLGNPQIADAEGRFAFPLVSVFVNTIYRVRLPDEPQLASPETAIRVQIQLTAKAPNKVRKGKKAFFSGRVSPAQAGALVEIQRRFRKQWITVRRTRANDSSRYRQGLRLRRSGKFRVVVTPSGAYISNEKSVGRIKVLPRRR